MFFGQFDHSIDEKGRVTIPARYREQLEDGACLTLGFDKNLLVMRKDDSEKLYLKVKGMSITDEKTRELSRSIFSNLDMVEFDKAGRILIPQIFREKLGLTTSVKLVGLGSYFEIWQPEDWEKASAKFADAETRATMFEGLDLTF